MSHISIVEVGPRDGLQNEAKTLSVQWRVRFIEKLSAAGLRRIEAGAFVSPKWVPQMQGSQDVFLALNEKKWPKDTRFSALTPNLHGFEQALKSGVKEVAVFGAASESFSKKNINCTIEESIKRFSEVAKAAKKNKIKVRGYLSTVFGCPYEGKVNPKKVYKLVERLLDLGIYEISLGDTIGVATPNQVHDVLKGLKKVCPMNKIAMHFHDTRGTALANVVASLDAGVKTFDSSAGGLGGCPYARGASGNLATEDLVYLLHGMKYSTGVDLTKLVNLSREVGPEIGHELPSKVVKAGGASVPSPAKFD